MPNPPLISVIIPCHNNDSTIGRAITSMLAQTIDSPIEIIIVDDHSTDNTEHVVAEFLKKNPNIRYAKLPTQDPFRINKKGVNINAGYSARNYGVSLAKGDIITFQDADDASLIDRLEIQYTIMDIYQSHHVVVDFQKYRDEYLGCRLGITPTQSDLIFPEMILAQLKRVPPIPKWLRDPYSTHAPQHPFIVLIKRVFRKLFIKDPKSYPCAANSAMVHKEVFEKIQFRPLWERTRPSLKGRGTDMDFNYAVAELFRDSIAIQLPLYLWQYKGTMENTRYLNDRFRPKP